MSATTASSRRLRSPRGSGSFVGVALLATAASCVISADREPDRVAVASPTYPAATGTLILRWTIDGVEDPYACSQSATDSIRISVYGADGVTVGTFSQDCGAFATSIVLEPGDYTATAVLLDPRSVPRTTSVDVRPFSILGNDQLNVPVDFPADSFFQPTL